MKTCSKCNESKPLEAFSPSRRGPKKAHCRECAYRWRRANPDKVAQYRRKQDLKQIYGLTLEEFDAMVEAQGGGCAICGAEKSGGNHSPVLCVDHDHESGEIRGLLCRQCNAGIGGLKDSPVLVRRALEYLEEHADKR